MATKKVILWIVEGPTDANLEPVLKKLFDRDKIHFHIVHGDMTIEKDASSANIITRVHSRVKQEMDRYGFRTQDILHVFHLIDTDGAFVPGSSVELGETERIVYFEDKILTPNIDSIIARNARKSSVVSRLIGVQKVGSLGYHIFYFSRNLEHVFHNISHELSDEEKVEYADLAAAQYGDDPESFVNLLQSSAIAAPGDYRETWAYIMQETNSLKRSSNLHLLFEEESFRDRLSVQFV